MSFYKRVYEVVKQIPKGKVMTYGQIAAICGSPKAGRFVGFALHSNKKPDIIPCHRVVNRFGQLSHSFAFGGIEAQKAMLEDEGVFVNEEYCVNLSKYLHHWK